MKPTIRLHDSARRQMVPLTPLDPENVRLYVCGPTVYARAHLGNARPVLVFDLLYRLLREVYGDRHVTYVRNFTDVDDKINARSAETGRDIRAITDETIAWYLEDMDALGALRPDHMPRATDYVGKMVTMIEKLLATGHAYVSEGHVLFSVASDPGYGQLSGHSLADLRAGHRVEVGVYKRDPLDFVLWKPSDEGEPAWEGPVHDGEPVGRGRPGWHIECSAMAHDLLGPSFDIHGGGLDLQFPHHENELAQSRCAHPEGSFAGIWMHNEMLQVEGRKMAKSAGNFFTVRDLLKQGVEGDVIRLVLLGSHYRKPTDWSSSRRAEAEAALVRWRGVLDRHGLGADVVSELKGSGLWRSSAEVLEALAADLNSPAVISQLHALASSGDRQSAIALAAGMELLGLPLQGAAKADFSVAERDLLQRILRERASARARKEWGRADMIRNALVAADIIVQDGPDGASVQAGPSFRAERLRKLAQELEISAHS